ncbi:MAG: thioredoxin [Clostridiales Family XIII bacterium]|nr:thioredoxin [Clostridiales Family XIII bacterium]
MSDVIVLNENNYTEITSSGVVVVDFYADWCGPCKMMAPIIDEAKETYEGKAVFAKIDVDESKSIALQNKVMSIPTLFFFKDGVVADRVSGVIDKGTLYAKLDALV